MASPFRLENPVFSKFALYSSVVLGKTLFMSQFTSINRLRKQVFANEEDAKFLARSSGVEVTTNDPLVERIRRCHLNDLENVLPFVLVGLIYVSTKPEITEATRVFQIFAASRVLHSVVYVSSARQPSRAASYFIGYSATWYMLYKILRELL